MENKNHSEIAPAVECKPAAYDDIDIIVCIEGQWCPSNDNGADVVNAIVKISDVGSGEICMEIGDMTIWISRKKLLTALDVIYGGRE